MSESTHTNRELRGKEAGRLWRAGQYSEARAEYEAILASGVLGLDRAKLLANIAQLLDEEGSHVEAARTVRQALDLLHTQGLWRSSEGTHLRGYLNGFLNRLEGRPRWARPPFSEALPLEMNLSMPERFRAHFSCALIGAAVSSALASQLEVIDQLQEPVSGLFLSWLFGLVVGWMATNGLLERMGAIAIVSAGQSPQAAMSWVVNSVTAIAILYIVLMPFLLIELAKAVLSFAALGLVGLVIFQFFKRPLLVDNAKEQRQRIRDSFALYTLFGLALIVLMSLFGGFVGTPHALLDSDKEFGVLSRKVVAHTTAGSLLAAAVLFFLWELNTLRIARVTATVEARVPPAAGCVLLVTSVSGMMLIALYLSDVATHLFFSSR